MVPNMEVEESGQQDEIDGWFDEMTKLSGYLEIRGTKFEQFREQEMAIAIEADNPEKKPAFLQKTRNEFKLIWQTEEERNKAVDEGIQVEGTTLKVEKPYRESGARPPRGENAVSARRTHRGTCQIRGRMGPKSLLSQNKAKYHHPIHEISRNVNLLSYAVNCRNS